MKTFLDYKNIDLKQPQNFHFPKGLVHGLSPKIFQTGQTKVLVKIQGFSIFSFDAKQFEEKCLVKFQKENKDFLHYKMIDLKKLPNCIFPKDTFQKEKEAFLDHKNIYLKKLQSWNLFKKALVVGFS